MSLKDKYLTFSKFENSSNIRSAVKLKRTLLSVDRYSASQMDTLSTGEIPKAIHLPPRSRQLIRQRPVFFLIEYLFQKLRKISQKIIFPEGLTLLQPLPSVPRRSWTLTTSSRCLPLQTYFLCCLLKAARVVSERAPSKVTLIGLRELKLRTRIFPQEPPLKHELEKLKRWF